jgi:hypothetical protein
MISLKGEKSRKKTKVWKITSGLMVLSLVSLVCLGPIIQASRVSGSLPVQELDALCSYDLKDRLLGYFIPTPNYILGAAGSLLSSLHSATIPFFDNPVSPPFFARLIDSAHGIFPAAISVESALKVRAPPLLSGKSNP